MTTHLDPSDNHLEVLSEDQCRELLASRNLGRITFPLGDETEIFPINYAIDGVIVVFRTAHGTKLAQVMASRVSFEIDEWNAAEKVGWSWGWAVLFGVLVALQQIAAPGGVIESLIYTKLPIWFQLLNVPEVVLLLFAFSLVVWVWERRIARQHTSRLTRDVQR